MLTFAALICLNIVLKKTYEKWKVSYKRSIEVYDPADIGQIDLDMSGL